MTALKVIVFAILATSVLGKYIPQPKLHEDVGLDVFELINKYGYEYERHGDIETEDGYLLEMHRIPYGNSSSKAMENRPVVLIMHGLGSSSADFCNMGTSSFAFYLADRGYDVWLGNARGNTWSRKHKTLDPDVDKAEFWAYSWNEIGRYDLPAKIDYILAKTGAEKIHYVGHSQGTTSFFVMGSERPEYNDKIALMQAYAPAAYMSHMSHPLVQFITQFDESIEWIINNIGLYEFLPHSEFIELVGTKLCDEDVPYHEICSHIFFLIGGYDEEQLDPAIIPVITTNTPAGTSSRQWLHYAQGIKSGHFRKYDYRSEEKNMEVYGQATPPDYDLSKLTAPVVLHIGQNDWLVAAADVARLESELPNVVWSNKIAFEKFNHLDFIWAKDVVELLHKDAFAMMEKYN